jgi:hypothetical protein
MNVESARGIATGLLIGTALWASLLILAWRGWRLFAG